MSDFLPTSIGVAFSMALLLFLIKLFFDRRASPRGVQGALAAPRRSLWLMILGFFAALVVFTVLAAWAVELSYFELFTFWNPDLLDPEDRAPFLTCLFLSAFSTVAIFAALHLYRHSRHLPWFGGRS